MFDSLPFLPLPHNCPWLLFEPFNFFLSSFPFSSYFTPRSSSSFPDNFSSHVRPFPFLFLLSQLFSPHNWRLSILSYVHSISRLLYNPTCLHASPHQLTDSTSHLSSTNYNPPPSTPIIYHHSLALTNLLFNSFFFFLCLGIMSPQTLPPPY